MNKKSLLILFGVVIICVIIGVSSNNTKKIKNSKKESVEDKTTSTSDPVSTPTPTPTPVPTVTPTPRVTSCGTYKRCLKMCAVMEAADIYTTGIGKKSNNAFNDGRASCELCYSEWGEREFIEIVSED